MRRCRAKTARARGARAPTCAVTAARTCGMCDTILFNLCGVTSILTTRHPPQIRRRPRANLGLPMSSAPRPPLERRRRRQVPSAPIELDARPSPNVREFVAVHVNRIERQENHFVSKLAFGLSPVGADHFHPHPHPEQTRGILDGDQVPPRVPHALPPVKDPDLAPVSTDRHGTTPNERPDHRARRPDATARPTPGPPRNAPLCAQHAGSLTGLPLS